MPNEIRITDNIIAIFIALLDSGREMYGLEIADAAEISKATIYAAITRMERAGLLSSTWEDAEPAEMGRPRRRLYQLTAHGTKVAEKAIAEYKPRVRPWRATTWRPGGSSPEPT